MLGAELNHLFQHLMSTGVRNTDRSNVSYSQFEKKVHQNQPNPCKMTQNDVWAVCGGRSKGWKIIIYSVYETISTIFSFHLKKSNQNSCFERGRERVPKVINLHLTNVIKYNKHYIILCFYSVLLTLPPEPECEIICTLDLLPFYLITKWICSTVALCVVMLNSEIV